MKDVAALYRRLASEACHELAWRMPALGIRAEEALSRLGDRISPPPGAKAKEMWQTLVDPKAEIRWGEPTFPTAATAVEVDKIIAELGLPR